MMRTTKVHNGYVLISGVVIALIVAGAQASGEAATPSVARSAWTPGAVAAGVPTVATRDGFADQLSTWGVEAGVVHVGLTAVSTRAVRALRKQYGPQTVVFTEPRFRTEQRVTVTHSPMRVVRVTRLRGTADGRNATPATSSPTRLLDATPYFGGDRIIWWYVNSNNELVIVQCTANFEVVLNSTGDTAAMTAGHCSPTGTGWFQGYYDTSNGTVYDTGSYGTNTDTSWGNDRPDGEILSGASLDPAIYLTNTTAVGDYGSAAVTKGEAICSDGSFSNEQCGGTVTAVNICAEINDNGTNVDVCGLDQATANHSLVQPGDSGGPVINTSAPPGYAQGVGIISAGSSNGETLLFTDMGIITKLFDCQVAVA